MPQAKTTTPTFVMELPLVLSDSEALLFAKTFEFARHIYNATLGTALKRLQRMREDSRWRKACTMPRGTEPLVGKISFATPPTSPGVAKHAIFAGVQR